MTTQGLVVLLDPVFTQTPDNACTETGASAAFIGQAANDEMLSYQWLEGDTVLTDGGRISGAQTTVLTLSGVTFADQHDNSVWPCTFQIPFVSRSPNRPPSWFSAAEGCEVCPRPGDLDDDGDYDLLDQQRFAQCFGRTSRFIQNVPAPTWMLRTQSSILQIGD